MSVATPEILTVPPYMYAERPIDRILPRLHGVVEAGERQWKALCPGHDDHTASLGLKETADGTLLAKCLAGCSTESVLDAIGAKVSDLFPGRKGRNKGKSSRSEDPSRLLEFVDNWNPLLIRGLVDAYPGTTAESLQLSGAKIAKYLPWTKEPRYVVALPSFVSDLRTPVGFTLMACDGGKIKTRDGSEKRINIGKSGVLGEYGWNVVLNQKDPIKCVFKVEGVSDELALQAKIPAEHRDAYPVITNAGGCGQSGLPKEIAKHFAGLNVVIIHDQDSPGQNGVKNWTQPLAAVAASIKNVQMPYELAESHGKDLRDWFNEGHTFEELLALCDQTAAVEKPPSKPDQSGDGDEPCYEDDDPHRLAKLFLDRRCTEHGEWRYKLWNEEFLKWDGHCYERLKNDALQCELTNAIQQEFDWIAREKMRQFNSDTNKKPDAEPPKAIKVKRGLVADAQSHVAALSAIPDSTPLNSWLHSQPEGFEPHATIPFRNGIISLQKLISGDPNYLHPPTSRYLCTSCIPFDFSETPPEPVGWLRFLNDLWPDDPESIACLQEWMGLFLTADTRMQKILLIVGPRRSGKGTIGRVIRALIGDENVAGPTLAGISTNFGLWNLIGKPVAIIADARLSSQTDAAIVAERLLSVSGEDAITIDRKNLPPITTTLPTRFVLMTNELPRLTDASNALAGRFVILRMVNSFYGQEDRGLTDRLLTELPGILTWAISGWQRLMENGRFTIPESSQDLVTQLEDAASPIGAFVRDCCEVDVFGEVDKSALFKAWQDWCESEGRAHPGTAANFAVQLRAAVSSVTSKRAKSMGVRINRFVGIKLK